tara:strand:- start:1769 stop:2158 length:390 start_codon:yes stop_codon:yes gene_type:complete
MKKQTDLNLKQNITFGLFFFIIFLIYGIYPLIGGEKIKVWSVSISLLLLLITLIKPKLLNWLNKKWIKLGILLGRIISPIIMALIFFFVVTPCGLIVRIIKKDLMGLNIKEKSYWIVRNEKIQNMKKQF